MQCALLVHAGMLEFRLHVWLLKQTHPFFCMHSRVEALQELQEKHDEVESQFRKERAELEAKYEKLYGKFVM